MTYSDINIIQYQAIREALSDGLDDVSLQSRLIAIVYGMDEDEVLDLPLDKYQKYSKGIRFLLDKPEDREYRRRTIRINGRRYRIMRDARDFTAAQWIDYVSWIKAGTDANLHNILSTILIPKGREYNKGYDITEVAGEIQQHLDIQTALVFFLHLRRRQSKSFRRGLHYSEAMTRILSKLGRKEIRQRMKDLNRKIREVLSHRDGAGLG